VTGAHHRGLRLDRHFGASLERRITSGCIEIVLACVNALWRIQHKSLQAFLRTLAGFRGDEVSLGQYSQL
jgi:hypothetical protein